ncbi:hypothetical protein [Streptacidiphilus jiangxiensis]|uniref:Uncharacterized protein n=1 Tax=Streptacidiphilus jiangxiensis TaxID=235985 RepID=A0A1H7RHB4_STRJI|nr:hypothetical protein [Streptacidiphilus jiangxiensis]SEL59582.1 hypothetical protein SAMN05414137_110134 [Streptacidiphilus jiangxiensis]
MTATIPASAAPAAPTPPAGRGASAAARTRAGRLRAVGPVPRLRLQAGAALLLLAALLVTAVLGFADTVARVHQLTAVSEPRAAAAGRLYQALADLDAQRAKSLVMGYSAPDPADPTAAPVLVDDGVLAALTAQADQRDASAALAQLAAAEPEQVQGLLNALNLYDFWTGTEEYFVGTQADPVVGHPVAGAVDNYAQADALLGSQLLPAVDALLGDADRQVSQDRAAAHDAALAYAGVLGGLGVATVLVLLWWQRDLMVRHNRVFNRPLVAATVCVAALLVGTTSALLGAAGEVDSAVSAGYTPYARLSQASVAAADAEARQSRWVVDVDYRSALAADFQGDAARVKQLLAADTSPAAAVVRQRFDAYLTSDTGLRQVAESGDVNGAALRLTGVGRDDAAFSYYDFSVHLGALAAADAAAFSAHASAAADDLSGWAAVSAAGLGVAMLLVLTGVRPRLREFA